MKVKEIAKYVRSKNAGPFWITIDIFCNSHEDFQILKQSPNLTADKVAEMYGVKPGSVQVFYADQINVIKYSFPRPHPQGSRYENDMHGGQQYVLLAEQEI